ncbi:MAG: LysR family transcriptional regulator [Candidatus Bathyarchaeia archaeon]
MPKEPGGKWAPAFKIWLEQEGRPAIGKGGAEILEAIAQTGSITKASESIGMSYKYVWDRLAEIEKAVGQPIIRTRRGGSAGGGGAELTEVGIALLHEYRRVERYVSDALRDREYWEAVSLKLSARNQLEGVVRRVEVGAVTAKIEVEILTPTLITAVITKEAVEELCLKVGDSVRAVVKSTEVMIAKE